MHLPAEVVTRILEFCGIPELLAASGACVAWRSAGAADHLWLRLAGRLTWDAVIVPSGPLPTPPPGDPGDAPEGGDGDAEIVADPTAARALVCAHWAFIRRQQWYQHRRREALRAAVPPPPGVPSGKKPQLLVTGLQGSGKTAGIYRLGLMPASFFMFHSGTHAAEDYITATGIRLTSFGVGLGHPGPPAALCTNPTLVLWVLDGADGERLPEAARELHSLVHDLHRRPPVLILVNKVDLPGSRTTAAVCEALRLRDLPDVEVYVQRCCLTTGDGLDATLQVLGAVLGRPL